MSEPEVSAGPDWDDVVDVICVGAGALAYGLCCARADVDVLLVSAPSCPDLSGLVEVMTDDLADLPADGELAVGSLVPESTRDSRATKLEPFVGSRLRDWSARCLASPYGVMFTQVPDMLTAMRDAAGEQVTAAVLGPYPPALAQGRIPLAQWLDEQADEYDLAVRHTLGALVTAEGRIAGAVLDTSAGPWRVAATAGLAIAVGHGAPAPVPPMPDGMEIAILGRPFGRFARLELVRR